MKIQITDIFSDKGTVRVKFNSPFGNATALWSGTKLKTGEILDVELELDEIFSWGQNIMSSSVKTPEITSANGAHKIIGELIQDADQSCSILKIGDSVILIEIDKPITGKPSFVEVITNDIFLHPTNV